MKKFSLSLLAAVLLLLPFHAEAATQFPDYEKYGRIATVVIKEDFPGEEVRDYKYMGRRKVGNEEVMDSFQFKVMENGKQILATVQITHHLKDKRTLSLTVTEQQEQ